MSGSLKWVNTWCPYCKGTGEILRTMPLNVMGLTYESRFQPCDKCQRRGTIRVSIPSRHWIEVAREAQRGAHVVLAKWRRA